MADDTNISSNQGRPDGAGRGNRQGGGRDSGGFRIRLSDNEMQAARALQEAFNLRSTVAVLGFSLRTLAQLLEEGKLEAVVSELRAQGQNRPGGGARQERGERGGERRSERERGSGNRGGRVDPFARPSRPAPAPAAESADEEPLETGKAAPEVDGAEALESSAAVTESELSSEAGTETSAES